MLYQTLKENLLALFDPDQLAAAPEEWGFANERQREVTVIGCAVSLTAEAIAESSPGRTHPRLSQQ